MDTHIAVTVLTGIGTYLGIRWIITSAFDGLRSDIDGLRSELTAEIRALGQRIDAVLLADRNARVR